MSRWAKEVTPDNVWQEYPRPQFERSTWKNLNGMWDYVILKPNQPKPKSYEGKILVPFSFESALSGVGRSITPEDKMWYRKKFIIPSEWEGKRILLNFEAVDHDTNVCVNDIFVGSHKGGFDRFSFDITTFLNVRGNQTIEVSVKDGTNLSPQLRGKQHFKPSGIVYTPWNESNGHEDRWPLLLSLPYQTILKIVHGPVTFLKCLVGVLPLI